MPGYVYKLVIEKDYLFQIEDGDTLYFLLKVLLKVNTSVKPHSADMDEIF